MDEAWRVLKPEGTAWINLGDTYFSKSRGTGGYGGDKQKSNVGSYFKQNIQVKDNMQEKTLMLIPHRFAIGCIDKGWILRNDIIWAKRNAMPESVRDRFSKKHEFVFFFTKQKEYYFDLDPIRNKHSQATIKRVSYPINTMSAKPNGYRQPEKEKKVKLNTKGKNPGDVSDFWDITTKSSKIKHYATYNSELIDKPIIAGCPEGGVILDPFAGSGTTLVRAVQLGRKAIGIEASEEYAAMARKSLSEELSQLKLF